MIRACIYIDGFNLYNRALKRRFKQYKWLDLGALCRKLLPDHDIRLIKYFTSLINADDYDEDKETRQQIYLRALKTIENLSIHYGRFQENVGKRALSESPRNPDGSWNTVSVLLPGEKGSDVNLATQMLLDGFKDRYDIAVLITNDSDFAEPIKAVIHELHREVWVYSPAEYVLPTLKVISSKSAIIWKTAFRDSQFPDQMRDSTGIFHKPDKWQ